MAEGELVEEVTTEGRVLGRGAIVEDVVGEVLETDELIEEVYVVEMSSEGVVEDAVEEVVEMGRLAE